MGIGNSGTLTVSNCILSNSGHGISNFGTLTVNNCVVSGNSGYGIYNNGPSGPASLTVVNSNVSDNGLSGIFISASEFGDLTATSAAPR